MLFRLCGHTGRPSTACFDARMIATCLLIPLRARSSRRCAAAGDRYLPSVANEYTNARERQEAQTRAASSIEGAQHHHRAGTRPQAVPGRPSRRCASRRPRRPGQRVEPNAQRSRDADSRAILEAELRKRRGTERPELVSANTTTASPRRSGDESRNYQKYLDRVADMQGRHRTQGRRHPVMRREIGAHVLRHNGRLEQASADCTAVRPSGHRWWLWRGCDGAAASTPIRALEDTHRHVAPRAAQTQQLPDRVHRTQPVLHDTRSKAPASNAVRRRAATTPRLKRRSAIEPLPVHVIVGADRPARRSRCRDCCRSSSRPGQDREERR